MDAIVAGAGIWGCTVARRLAEAGRKVLVLEKRAAIGGNCRCEIDPETGIEVRHYHPEWKVSGEQQTVIMREYSGAWKTGDEPYYPIASPESAALLARYQEEVEGFNHRSTPTPSTYTFLTVGGRSGGYRCLDMDQAMAAALEIEV